MPDCYAQFPLLSFFPTYSIVTCVGRILSPSRAYVGVLRCVSLKEPGFRIRGGDRLGLISA